MSNRVLRTLALGWLLVGLMAGSALAQGSSKSIALIMTSKGDAQVKKGDTEWRNATFGTVLDAGDMLRTGPDGFIAIVFTDDKTQLKIRPNTSVTVDGSRDETYGIAKRVNMELGELMADVTKQKGALQIATPTSVASVKGTEFWVIVGEDGTTQVLTLQGLVELLSILTGQTIDLGAGMGGSIDPSGILSTMNLEDIDVPTFLEEEFQLKSIEVRFIDEEGNERTLIIQYQQGGE